MPEPNNSPLVHETIRTTQRNEMIDITELVAQHMRAAQLEDGLVVVYCPHTTAGVTVQENADPDVRHDVLAKLAQIVPHREPYYQHAEGNSDAHLKAMLVGSSVTLIVNRGRLVLGPWQGVYFCEFDGPRERRVMMKAMKT